MILVEFTPSGGSLYRLSTEDIALTEQWFGYVISIDSLKLSLPTRHGGYAKPTFSSFRLSPDLMVEIGSYPKTAAVSFLEKGDALSTTTVFSGSARLDSFDRYGFNYVLTKANYEKSINSGTAYNATLVSVMTTLCTSLGLTLNSTSARSPSPAVLHTTPSDILTIDLMSEMCSFFSHGFSIVGATLYLYDMVGAYTPAVLTEFDTQPCEYRYDTPYSLFRATDSQSLDGSDKNGEEYSVTAYHTTTANIQAALGDIKTIMEQPIATMRWKTDETKPALFSTINYLDESLPLPMSSAGILTSIVYNYETLSVEAELNATFTV